MVLDVRARSHIHTLGTAAYIEEGVVRRELSDNFVYYTPDTYDTYDAAAGWARESLDLHASDVRESVYVWRELEEGRTHDGLWNAAQLQLVREGKMHGFMRSECVIKYVCMCVCVCLFRTCLFSLVWVNNSMCVCEMRTLLTLCNAPYRCPHAYI